MGAEHLYKKNKLIYIRERVVPSLRDANKRFHLKNNS